jgi:hydroxyacylglutathione hydrolase
MLLRQLYDEDLAQAAWLIGCQKTREAIVVDPARDVDRYIDLAKRHDLKITAVAETHIHADFLSGARGLADATGARVHVSGEGGRDWRSGWLEGYDHLELHDGDSFRIGGIKFTALHTPGHTPEHVSYLVTDLGGGADEPLALLSGDFVFVGDLGRPDLLETAAGIEGVMEAGAKALAESARTFLTLPDFMQILPAHGAGSACGKALGAIPQSTVGYERRFNRALGLAGDEDAFVANMLSGQPAPPLYFARMKRENRDGVPPLAPLQPLPETTPEALAESGLQVIDLRPWDHFRAGHLPGSLWSKPGPFFAASIGSYVETSRELALVCAPEDVDRLHRGLARIGLDHVRCWCPIETFEAARTDTADGGLEYARIREITAEQFIDARESGNAPRVLDVRRGDEFDAGHLDGAINIPHTRLMDASQSIPVPDDDAGLLVQCLAGVRSAAACSALQRDGHTVTNLRGGWNAWRSARRSGTHQNS